MFLQSSHSNCRTWLLSTGRSSSHLFVKSIKKKPKKTKKKQKKQKETKRNKKREL